MVQLYNFKGSWQLFPEKGNYEEGQRPKSGFYKIETDTAQNIRISHSWVTLANKGFETHYELPADGTLHPFETGVSTETASVHCTSSNVFTICFYNAGIEMVKLDHYIEPNGFLKIIKSGFREDGSPFVNTEFFHKQMSILPYAATVSGAVIRPTKEGVIKHKALEAMEAQTDMQLEQIRQQVELLAMQAQAIYKRKELSLQVYNAKLSFKPEIGQVYHLYEKKDGSALLSLIAPKEWGASMAFEKHLASVQLLADHTWKEV